MKIIQNYSRLDSEEEKSSELYVIVTDTIQN